MFGPRHQGLILLSYVKLYVTYEVAIISQGWKRRNATQDEKRMNVKFSVIVWLVELTPHLQSLSCVSPGLYIRCQ